MSSFSVPVVAVDDIEPIEGADRVELARVAGYRCVVKKAAFAPGDAAVYIPEGAILPEWLLRRFELWDEAKGVGKLAGKGGDRVKAVKLRGCLSQGLLYPVEVEASDPASDGLGGEPELFVEVPNRARDGQGREVFPRGFEPVGVSVGDDLAETLGVVKYEPPVPTDMAGEVTNLHGKTVKYDLENLKAHPDAFSEGEAVEITEKLHGTLMQIGVRPGLGHESLMEGGDVFVASKGLGEKGLVFADVPENANNLYIRAYRALTDNRGRTAAERFKGALGRVVPDADASVPIHVFAEVFGEKVQDLTYGRRDVETRGFDVYVGERRMGRFLDADEKRRFFAEAGMARVPVLYRGAWSREVADELVSGESALDGADHLREGIVITPVRERKDTDMGRVALKHVSEAYLTRKGGTEYN